VSAVAPVELVEYEPAWLHELVRMWRASFEGGVGIVDPHPLAEQEAHFQAEVVPRNAVRLALVEGRLAGFVAASRESIAQLHVRVGLQRRGIGARMLAWAKDQSGGSLWLYTFARNAGARAFYERHGFVAVAHGFEPFWQLADVKYVWTAHAQNRR
jgi:ribosomal protein S18 acetylase RimI-like enzyme